MFEISIKITFIFSRLDSLLSRAFNWLHNNWPTAMLKHLGPTSIGYSFICQGTSTRRERSDLFGLRVKLPPVTTSLALA